MAAVPSIGRASLVEAPRRAPQAAATEGLYERHSAKILAYCRHQLGSREEAEDAVQTTFMNAFRALGRGVVPEAETAWLFKIAENVCLSRRRSSWRRGRIESPSDFEVIEEVVPGPSRQRDELIGIEDALASMPEQQRRAILLREWQGLSYREIADELEVSQSAVETLIFRARRSLAQGLEQPETLKPKRKGLRRALHAVDLGTIAAALKTFLAGSAAVKATAAAVAVTAAAGTVATVGPELESKRHSAPPEPAAASAAAPASAAAVAPATAGATLVEKVALSAPEREAQVSGKTAALSGKTAAPAPAAKAAEKTERPARRTPPAVAAAGPEAEQGGQAAEQPVVTPAAEPQQDERRPEAPALGRNDEGKQANEGTQADEGKQEKQERKPAAAAPERTSDQGREERREEKREGKREEPQDAPAPAAVVAPVELAAPAEDEAEKKGRGRGKDKESEPAPAPVVEIQPQVPVVEATAQQAPAVEQTDSGSSESKGKGKSKDK